MNKFNVAQLKPQEININYVPIKNYRRKSINHQCHTSSKPKLYSPKLQFKTQIPFNLYSRSAVRQGAKNGNVRSRSRSRTRKGQVGQAQKQQGGRAPRGRSQQRRGNNNSGQRGGGSNGKAQSQQRRGRSRSRTGRGGNNRNQGKNEP